MLLREKYYKKQIELLDGINLKEELDKLDINEKIVGYLYYSKNGENLLNLYLNEKDDVIKKQEVIDNLIVFKNTNGSVFKNPPLDIWLNNKDAWCKSLAKTIAKTYCLEYREALSEVYFTIVKLYNKNKFLDNLAYIQSCVKNNISLKLRRDKNKLNGDNVKVVSLDTIVQSNEDNNLTLEQMIENPNCINPENNAEFLSVKKEILKVLEKSFSKREIEQIATYPVTMLPSSLFSRLSRWRKKNTLESILER